MQNGVSLHGHSLVVVVLDDLFGLAHFGPVVQVSAVTLVQHLGRLGQGGGQFLGAFETFVLAFVDDFALAAIQAAVDEFATRFQDVLWSVDSFFGVLNKKTCEASGHRQGAS